MLRPLVLPFTLLYISACAYGAAPTATSTPCELDLPRSTSTASTGNAAPRPQTKHVKLKIPQCYAHELALLTSAYLSALENQVTSQQTMYSALATSYVSADREATGLGLDVTRDAQVQKWIGHLADGSLTPNEVIEDATRLATAEFAATKVEEERALDGKSAYLATLANLSSDTARIASLVSLFDALATPSTFKTTMGDLASFGETTAAQMKNASCALATSRLTYFQAESSSVAALTSKGGISESQKAMYTSQKTAVDQQITTLQKQAAACTAPSK